MLRRCGAAAACLAVLLACCGLQARQNRADEILARAREAIGGEARLGSVRSLSLKASARTIGAMLYRTRDYVFVDDTERHSKIEVDIALPDKFVVARTPEGATSRQLFGINGDRLIAGTMASGGYRPTVFVGPLSGPAMVASRQREFVRYVLAWLLVGPGPDEVTFADAGSADTPDGPADLLDAKGPYQFAARLYFDRQTHRLSMVEEPPSIRPPGLSTPPAITRRTESPLRDIIETPDGTATLTFDTDTHRLTNLTFEPRIVERPQPAQPASSVTEPPDATLFRSMEPPDVRPSGVMINRNDGRRFKSNQPVDVKYVRAKQMRLGDYRAVDGILLPHRVTIDTGTVEEWAIASFKVNEKIDPKRFAPR